jgi:hypothetical protein
MELRIPDDLDGVERKRWLQVLPVFYAIDKFGEVHKAAEWLGSNKRKMLYIMRNNDELRFLIQRSGECDFVLRETKAQQMMKSNHLRQFFNSFDYYRMSEQQRMETVKRIESLYR